MHVQDRCMETPCREHAIGELCVAGDQACEHGDLLALTEIAERWLEHISEPLHCELVPLVRACADPERATAAWTRLKEKLRGEDPGS